MGGTGIDWAGWIGVAGGIGGVVGGLAALLAWLGPSRREVMDDLAGDATFREDAAARLRDGSLGRRYRDGLDRGMRRLDRAFGPPASAKALGRCIIVAIVYPYAGFFLVWGLGGPGVVGGIAFLSTGGGGPARLEAGAALALMPLLGYWLGRRLGPSIRGFKRRLITRLLRMWRRPRPRRISVDRCFRLVASTALLLMLTRLVLMVTEDAAVFLVSAVMLCALPAAGVVAGVAVRDRVRSEWTGPLASVTAGIGVVALAGALFGAATVAAISVLAGVAGAVGIAYAYGFAISFAFTLALAGTAAITITLAYVGSVGAIIALDLVLAGVDDSAIAIAVAVAAVAAIAVAVGLFLKPGAFPGSIGIIIAISSASALGGRGFVEEYSLVLLVFFLVLPLINGGVDWGSWWVTRRLGAHLLRVLDGGVGALRLGLVVFWHGVADFALAAFMLLAMAFVLALGFEAYNQASLWTGPAHAFDLEVYVDGAAAAPFTEGAWLSLMLLTTLLPTFLHVVVVWMSPLGLLFLSARREAWADHLERWDELDDATRSRTRRAVAAWVAHGRIGLWLLAGLLALGLFALMAGAVAMVHQGGFADYVARAANLGIETARWLGGR